MYEDYSHFYLVMDLISGGEMFDHLSHDGAYSEADAARLIFEIASALAFLHGVGTFQIWCILLYNKTIVWGIFFDILDTFLSFPSQNFC